MSDNGGGEYGGDMGAVMRLAGGLRDGGGQYGQWSAVGAQPSFQQAQAEINRRASALAGLVPPRIDDATERPIPEATRREALNIANEFWPDASVCQTIQNADLIARWLHAGSVPQV